MSLIPRSAGPAGLALAGVDWGDPAFLGLAMADLWSFLAVAAGRHLVGIPKGVRLHVSTKEPSPICGQHTMARWAYVSVLADARQLCRRCIGPAHLATESMRSHRDQVAQLLADALREATTSTRVDHLRSIAILADLTAYKVYDRDARHMSDQIVRLRSLIGTVAREQRNRAHLSTIAEQPALVAL